MQKQKQIVELDRFIWDSKPYNENVFVQFTNNYGNRLFL